MRFPDAMRFPDPPNPTDGINQAQTVIAFLERVQDRVAYDGALYRHIEWAKEAVWAATYPGDPENTLLNDLERAGHTKEIENA